MCAQANGKTAPDFTIWYDTWGIPHVRAGTSEVAFYAQGWCQAHDRLWQLAADRQKGVGAWASWVGGQGLENDRLHRRLDLAGAARADYAALDKETRSAFIAFAAGVNAGAAALDSVFELDLLEIDFEPWEPWHSILVFKTRHVSMGGHLPKLWRALVLRQLGPEALATLRYDEGPRESSNPHIDAREQTNAIDIDQLTANLVALGALPEPGGSNAWAISGDRTASGLPLVAGDPHRAFEQPNVYYQQHIACDDFDVIGFAIPGIPGFTHFGHNKNVAWCITHAFIDDQDLFVERLSKDRFLDGGEWRDLEVESSRIEVRGGASVDLMIERTSRGPLVLGGSKLGIGMSLAWTSLARLEASLAAMLPMIKSRSVAELHRAVDAWVEPGNSLISADTAGQIGYRIRGAVPKRPEGNRWLPAAGWEAASQWQGMVADEALPSEIDPECGFLVTANNRPFRSDLQHSIGAEFQPPDRCDRIRERIQSLDAATVEDMEEILRDVSSRPARLFAKAALDGAANSDCRSHRAAQLLFRDWAGTMSADSAAAAFYAVFRNELTLEFLDASGLRAIREDWIRDEISVGLTADLWWIVPRLLRNQDTSLLGSRNWSELAAAALERAYEILKERLGEDPLYWRWGDLHKTLIGHPLRREFAKHRKALDPPSASIGGDGDTICASGFQGRHGFIAVYGSVARYVFDLSDWNRCRWIVPMGSANEPGSAHRHDQFPSWCRGELIPMLYDWSRIQSEAVEELEFFLGRETKGGSL